MNTYVLYNPETEAIVSVFSCSEYNAGLQVRNGLEMLALSEGFPGNPDDYKIMDGQVVKK